MEEGARELNDDGVLNQIFRLGGRIKLPWVGGPKNNVSKSLKDKSEKVRKLDGLLISPNLLNSPKLQLITGNDFQENEMQSN